MKLRGRTKILFAGLMFSLILAAALAAGMAGTGRGQQPASSRAYVGHETDADIKGFVSQYPRAAGTRLDDCQTCHRGGIKGTDTEKVYSPCGYCHLCVFPDPRLVTGVPKTPAETLNAYGIDYKAAGRTFEAFAAIGSLDSDEDGYSNAAEIADGRNPGDAASRPGLPLAATIVFGWDQIRKLPVQTQFMLMNTTKEPTDDYVLYKGARIIDLLSSAGIYTTGVAGITVFAPDGYSVDFSAADLIAPFPRGFYYAAPRTFEGTERAFVRYPPRLPDGLRDGWRIPGGLWLLLAYERNGQALDTAAYEKGTGRMTGEGPYRVVKPQRDLYGDPKKPGRPDRPQRSKVFGDGWDFVPGIDHNAGSCVRGVCVIRVNPMPEGYEEYDWKNGWPLIGDKKVVIYGRGVR